MDKKIIAILVVVVVVIVAAAAAVVVLNDDDDDKYEPEAYSDSGVRLKIYGNANGDDVIDSKDIDTIQMIIDANNDSDTTKHIDWKSSYYFADANHDGKIDSSDIQYVQDIIDKKKVKMWYETAFAVKDTYATGENKHLDAYVNYPVGHKIGCEYTMADLLCVLGVYDYFAATDNVTPGTYGNATYPGIESLPSMGTYNDLKIETLEQMYKDGTIDGVIMWSGGTSTMYLWDDAVKSGVADDVSIFMLQCQGPYCINGVLMMACMLGDQSLSDKYSQWYDSAMEKIDKIGDTVQKKKVMTVQMTTGTTSSTLRAYGQYLGPAIWFNKILTFVDPLQNTSKIYPVGTAESLQDMLEAYNIDEMVLICIPKSDGEYENFNSWAEGRLHDLFQTLPIYENQKIYLTWFGLQPFYGGPASCMLLAAQLYPDDFSMDEAFEFTQEYIDMFTEVHHDAHQGYTYTGSGYYPYNG